MKKFIAILFTALLMVGCTSLDENPYSDTLQTLKVRAIWPEGYESYTRSGVSIKAVDIATELSYTQLTDEEGSATFRIPKGQYRLSLSDMADRKARFNGVLESVRLIDQDLNYEMPLIYLRPGTIVIKEIYNGGCPKLPIEGRLQNDQYIILHNNDCEVQYLDKLCFGAVDPYTSASQMNGWVTKGEDGHLMFQDFAPIVECSWIFPGEGKDFPLQPGEDAVLVIKGAVDFTKDFPMSVNLNKKDYFVCHSRLHFENETQHITPGDQIQPNHILSVVKKTGRANAFVISINSPALVLFRCPDNFDLEAYAADDSRCVATVPGGNTKCFKAPWDWVLDGVEVFFSTNNNKRMHTEVDAEAVTFSVLGLGHTLHRKLDVEATQAAGYEIYMDTNNSKNDFEERPTQSLHE